jgi:hypothetical protein
MRISDANKLTVGKPTVYRDPIALVYFAGTVTAISPGVSLTVSTPGGASYPPAPLPPGATTKPTSQTFSLEEDLDGTIELPLVGPLF